MPLQPLAACALICALGSAPVPEPAAESTTAGYRFTAPPIVPFMRTEGGYAFDAYVRLNRSLVRDRQGAPRGSLLVNDAGGTNPIGTLGKRGRHCYTAAVDPSFNEPEALKKPKVGRRVTVTLVLNGEVVARRSARLSRPLPADGEDVDRPYARALRCLPAR